MRNDTFIVFSHFLPKFFQLSIKDFHSNYKKIYHIDNICHFWQKQAHAKKISFVL